MTPRPNLMNYF